MKKVPSGFTLVELMSTVAIIGILAIFSVHTYQDYIVKEQLRSIEVAAEHIHMAQTRFFSDHMSLPGGARYARTLTELTPYLPGTSVLRHAGNTRSKVLGTNETSSTIVGDSFICSFTAANVTDYKNHYIVDFKFPSSGKSIVSNSNKYKMYYRAQASDAVTQITWRNVSGGELPRIK